MRTVFADTCYWIAFFNPEDSLHLKAKKVTEDLEPFYAITTEMVLVEFLNVFADKGEPLRSKAANFVHQLKSASNCEAVPQTSILFRDALKFYSDRPDKDWGLTDCASFLTMENRRITFALTHDKHFLQAGFTALLREAPDHFIA